MIQECVPLEVAAAWQTAMNENIEDISVMFLILVFMLVVIIVFK